MQGKKLAEIIEHLLNKHHKYLRDVMPVIKKELDSVKGLRIEGDLKPVLDSASEIIADIDIDVSQHLMKEENILFPTIKALEESTSAGSDEPPIGCGVQGPVTQMLYEHNTLKESVKAMEEDINRISDLLKGTEHADKEFVRSFIKNALELKTDFLEHIKIEEEDLFPQALSMESKAMGGL